MYTEKFEDEEPLSGIGVRLEHMQGIVGLMIAEDKLSDTCVPLKTVQSVGYVLDEYLYEVGQLMTKLREELKSMKKVA